MMDTKLIKQLKKRNCSAVKDLFESLQLTSEVIIIKSCIQTLKVDDDAEDALTFRSLSVNLR